MAAFEYPADINTNAKLLARLEEHHRELPLPGMERFLRRSEDSEEGAAKYVNNLVMTVGAPYMPRTYQEHIQRLEEIFSEPGRTRVCLALGGLGLCLGQEP